MTSTTPTIPPKVAAARAAAIAAAAAAEPIPTAGMTDNEWTDIVARARRTVEVARAVFTATAPYWADTAFALAWVPVRGLGTFGVTARGQLVYDPGAVVVWADKWSTDAIAGVIAHEIMHVILLHVARVDGRHKRLWNMAADLFINGALRSAGWKLPPLGLYPEQFIDKHGVVFPEGLTADEYYEMLVTSPMVSWVPDTTAPMMGQCGTGAGGEELKGEPGPGELDPSTERSIDDLRTTAEAAARATAEAAAKGVGNVPGAMARWAADALRPSQVHWTTHLRVSGSAVVARAGRGRRSYVRPHRRQACMGLHPRTPILPVSQRTVVNLLFAIDTSGSMSRDEIITVASEMVAIAKARRGRVFVVACDSDVQGEPVELRGNYLPTLERIITGGGGTDFRPVFTTAEGMTPRPDLVVIGTDAGGPVPSRRPDIPTIWLSTTGERPYGCTWGELIHVTA